MAARIFGFTFAAKFMEYGEMDAQELYGKIAKVHPDIKPIINIIIEVLSKRADMLEKRCVVMKVNI